MRISITTLLVVISLSVNAQSKLDLRLNHLNDQNQMSCFNMDLRSPDHEEIELAGQNYRIFYDASKAELLEDKTQLSTSLQAYSAADIVNTTQGNIGFLSISVDARVNNDHTVKIPSDGSWVTVGHTCFLSKGADKYDLVWANDRTENYASAQVTLSKWINKEVQVVVDPNLMIDYTALHQSADLIADVSVYPNPTIDLVNVKIEDPSQLQTIIIKDVIGREVVSEKIQNRASLRYDLSQWPSGRYTIEILSPKGDVYTESIIKTDAQ